MDPLAQLKDIHLPGAVHNYPIAPGWWLLALIALTLLVFSLIKLRQFVVKRRVKKQAIKQLTKTQDAVAIVNILKWALLAYFPRSQVAHLSGNNLKTFLTETMPIKHQENFQQLCAQHFNSVYQSQKDNDVTTFLAAATLWLNQALPPKLELDDENTSPVSNHLSVNNSGAQAQKLLSQSDVGDKP
jgi:hypothetical protein